MAKEFWEYFVHTLGQGFPNFSAHDPQNNSARDWGSPLTLEVACNVVHSHAHALLGLYKHRHQNGYNIILK